MEILTGPRSREGENKEIKDGGKKKTLYKLLGTPIGIHSKEPNV